MIDVNIGDQPSKDQSWFENQYKKAYVDLTQKPKKPEGIIAFGTKQYLDKVEPNYIFTKGELSVISAPSKSYKSTFKSHLASAFFNSQDESFDFITGKRNKNESLLDVDTEQGKFYSWHTFNRVKRMCKGIDISRHYLPFKLRHLSATDRVTFIDFLIKSKKIPKPSI